jgi:hypothetical protein
MPKTFRVRDLMLAVLLSALWLKAAMFAWERIPNAPYPHNQAWSNKLTYQLGTFWKQLR